MYRIWATASHSLWDISLGLRGLNVTHTVESSERAGKIRKINMKHEQPRAVHLAVRPVFVTGAINFISVPFGVLADSNYPQIPEIPLEDALIHCLTNAQRITPVVKELDAADYVMALAKPSVLNKIQTQIYRIQPYDLRKEVQALVIRFFNGLESQRSVMQFLDRSMKTERLKPLIVEGLPLRDAVLMMKSKPIEQIEAETGMQSFDLLYLTKALK